MKAINFPSNWGSTEFEPSSLELSGIEAKMFVTVKGPRGGDPRSGYLLPVEALGLAEYLKAWALEALK